MTEKEKTAPIVSVGADTEQSSQKCSNNSITFCKGCEGTPLYYQL